MISDDELDRRLRDALGAVAATVTARNAANPSSMTAPTANTTAPRPASRAADALPNTREDVPRLPAPRLGRGWALPASLAAVVAVIVVTVALVASTSNPDAPTQPGAPGATTPATNQTLTPTTTNTVTASSDAGAPGDGQTVQPGQPPADGTTTTTTIPTTTIPTSTSPSSPKVPTSSNSSR